MKHLLPALALLFAAARPAAAQETGLTFLRIGVNAAASAMGDAQAAASQDAFSTFWNPAGLAATTNTVAASHRIWIGDVRAYDLAARFQMGAKGALGLALTATDSGDLEARDGPGEPTGAFSAQFISAGASYARAFGPLRAGITAKYLRERIFDTNASGYALDAGLQFDIAPRFLTLGASIRNVGRMSELQREATTLPRVLHVGAALYPFYVMSSDDGERLIDLMVSAEMSHLLPSDLTRLHMGTAVTVLELVDIRGGYITGDALRNFTFGLGLRYDAMLFDYAYIPFEGGFEGPGHILSVAYAW